MSERGADGAIVLGAGVAGLWAALALVRRGVPVRLFDPAGGPGPQACSWWAGGMLAPLCEGALCEPVVVRHGEKAAAAWASVTPVTQRGTLVVALARDQGELAHFAARTQGHTMVEARDYEVDLPAGKALFFDAEAHLNPRGALADLRQALAAQGVQVERAGAVPPEHAGPVIDCRGMAAAPDLPGLRGVRGEMVLLHAPDVTLSRPVRLLHPRHPLYLVPRGNGVFMLGATQVETERRGPVTARALLELLSAAYALNPAFAEAAVLETGADLRPAFADHVPRVVCKGRVLHLNGLFRHGFLMAPALAETAAAYLSDGSKGELFHED